METYLVGGAVRDRLLGLPVTDRDWTVVGASPQQMLDAGFRMVGRDFPVFLHPQTGEEYALARTERKTGPGYAGFAFHAAPDVTLEQDLARRDLTINAMAQSADGALIDPYGGRHDLAARVLRHVSPAFAEDPVRILRLARFAARFADFHLADETLALARTMVDAGEVDALVAERVWQELARGLMEAHPSRLFGVLRDCGALARLLPELERRWSQPMPSCADSRRDAGGGDAPLACGAWLHHALDAAAARSATLPVRFALVGLVLSAPEPATGQAAAATALAALCERLRVPVEVREQAALALRERDAVARSNALDATGLATLLQRGDAYRRPERFDALLDIDAGVTAGCGAVHATGVDGAADANGADAAAAARGARLRAALRAARGVDSAAVAAQAQRQGLQGPAVGAAIEQARAAAIAAALDGSQAS